MAKQIKIKVKLQIPAGKATPAPPVGTALGPHGINLGEFVSRFNDGTRERGSDIVPVEVTIFVDRSFEMVFKTAPASDLLRKAARPFGEARPDGAAGIEKGSGTPLQNKVGKISKQDLETIAAKKMEDLNANDIEGAKKIIAGTARSMGIEIQK
ncbi:MAG: 50S ribosomal protein L11 [Patescibacteria group bacterium]